MMKDPHEIILSIADAALLRCPLGDRANELLRHAHTRAPEHLPEDRVAVGSNLVYLEGSPAGLALLGRRSGSVVMSELANGWPFTVRVIEVTRSSEKEAA